MISSSIDDADLSDPILPYYQSDYLIAPCPVTNVPHIPLYSKSASGEFEVDLVDYGVFSGQLYTFSG